jgi:hypothetical protein
VAKSKGFLSVSKELFAKLKKESKRTGAPINVLVELAIAPAIGLELSPLAAEWRERLLPRATATP